MSSLFHRSAQKKKKNRDIMGLCPWGQDDWAEIDSEYRFPVATVFIYKAADVTFLSTNTSCPLSYHLLKDASVTFPAHLPLL
jgi:hypothetical protein